MGRGWSADADLCDGEISVNVGARRCIREPRGPLLLTLSGDPDSWAAPWMRASPEKKKKKVASLCAFAPCSIPKRWPRSYSRSRGRGRRRGAREVRPCKLYREGVTRL